MSHNTNPIEAKNLLAPKTPQELAVNLLEPHIKSPQTNVGMQIHTNQDGTLEVNGVRVIFANSDPDSIIDLASKLSSFKPTNNSNNSRTLSTVTNQSNSVKIIFYGKNKATFELCVADIEYYVDYKAVVKSSSSHAFIEIEFLTYLEKDEFIELVSDLLTSHKLMIGDDYIWIDSETALYAFHKGFSKGYDIGIGKQ